MKYLVLMAALLLSGAASAQGEQPAPKKADPISESDIAYPYRLFETTNIWTFILLDTVTGRAWQVQYSVDDTPAKRVFINESSFLPEGVAPKNGRFTLYPTHNMYNFLLLDREDGRIWQLQWSLESESRGIMRSIPLRWQQEYKEKFRAEESQRSLNSLREEYILAIIQKIERNWRQPQGITEMPDCEVRVIQGPGGVILDVSFGACQGGSKTYRSSIEDAVYKADPLPKPGDPSLFERELIILFSPS